MFYSLFMKNHHVRVYASKEKLSKQEQLAWKLAQVALDTSPVISREVQDMVINRLIDNTGVAIAAINRDPVKNARSQALAHPRPMFPFQGSEGSVPPSSHSNSHGSPHSLQRGTSQGARLFGLQGPSHFFEAPWAAWANGVAVRELDFHDTFLAADYSHPGDNIPSLLAVAQQKGCKGKDLLQAIVASYEIQMNLVKGICLHKYKKDHIAHLCPAQAAGLGCLLGLSCEVLYQAIGQAVHTSFNTRQSRKGEISSWKAYAPAHAGKLAIEAIDRAMRGERSPSPIYEGEDSVIAYMLGGAEESYTVPLPELGEEKKAILESYTKEHSAEYQAQALIDLAFEMRKDMGRRGGIDATKAEGAFAIENDAQTHRQTNLQANLETNLQTNLENIEKIIIYTSHHTHFVIGSGAGDPQKKDPRASRETLDHSISYIFAVALQDGKWHHEHSYEPARAQREDTVQLWQKINTVEDNAWTESYHHPDPCQKGFGGKVVIDFKNGFSLTKEMKVAKAHPAGSRPFGRKNYIEKFCILTEDFTKPSERERFLDLVQALPKLSAKEVQALNLEVKGDLLEAKERDQRGLF